MRLGHLCQAHAAGTVTEQGRPVDFQWGAADAPAFQLGTPHAGPDPFDNKVAFQFGDGTDDDDHGAAQRAAAIDVLAEADELDVQPVELVEHVKQVTDRAGDPVEGPDHDDVELAAAGVGQQLVQSGAPGLGAADPVGVLLDDLEATLLGQGVQVMLLGLWMLIQSGHSKINGSPFQRRAALFFGATPCLAT